MPDPRMKVVIAGPDGAGKSCLLSFLKKTMEDRFNSVMSVMVEAPLMLRMETHSKESKYAKVFEFWEDSKNYESFLPLLGVMYGYVDIALICYALDEMIWVNPDGAWEVLNMRLWDAVGGMEASDRRLKSRKNPTVFLVGCRGDLLDDNSALVGQMKIAQWRQNITSFVAENGLHGYFECSAVTGAGINEILDAMVDANLHPPKRRVKLPQDQHMINRKRIQNCIIS